MRGFGQHAEERTCVVRQLAQLAQQQLPHTRRQRKIVGYAVDMDHPTAVFLTIENALVRQVSQGLDEQ